MRTFKYTIEKIKGRYVLFINNKQIGSYASMLGAETAAKIRYERGDY